MNALNAGIYTTLSGGTALAALVGTALYYQAAPDGAALPYVKWSYQGGGPLNITASDMRDLLIYARGYASTPDMAGSIDAAVSALLHRQTITVSGYTNFWTARETEVHLEETTPAGEHIFSAGAIYRVRLDD